MLFWMCLASEDLKVDDDGYVRAISSCPVIAQNKGCVVTGTFTHLNNDVLELTFENSDLVLQPTGLHPLWSEDRNDWVRAGLLMVGEHLMSESGPLEIATIQWVDGTHQVFNLEVARDHTYLVGADAVLSHNVNACRLPRFEGPKPKYHVNPAHVPGQGLRRDKTILPKYSEEVFKKAVPGYSDRVGNWFGKNADGQIYRYSRGNDGTAHYSGTEGWERYKKHHAICERSPKRFVNMIIGKKAEFAVEWDYIESIGDWIYGRFGFWACGEFIGDIDDDGVVLRGCFDWMRELGTSEGRFETRLDDMIAEDAFMSLMQGVFTPGAENYERTYSRFHISHIGMSSFDEVAVWRLKTAEEEDRLIWRQFDGGRVFECRLPPGTMEKVFRLALLTWDEFLVGLGKVQ
jgi:hypothetical protein